CYRRACASIKDRDSALRCPRTPQRSVPTKLSHRIQGRALTIRRHQVLQRNDASVGERNRFVRVGHAWRDIGIIKWIVKGIAKENEAAVMMSAHDASEPKSAAESAESAIGTITITTIWVWVSARLRVYPSLGRT